MVRMRSHPALRAASLFAVTGYALAAVAGDEIHGAGATFPAPVYAAWSAAYGRSTGVRVTYDSVGSGAGVERMRRREVDFGASDAPLAPQELEASGLLQFPVIIGGVVPVINISGIKPGQLQLTGAVLADIYLGRIRKWNDMAIATLNPKTPLPNTNITVVHRSDASGTSLLWTDYLSRSSQAWRAAGGASLEPNWPTGSGGIGNEGVASYVQRTRFAIGYVEYYFAREHHLSDVALRNQSGRFVRAGREAFGDAATANWADVAAMRQLATDSPGPDSWPITGASFILVPKSPQDGAHTRAVLQFFDWGLHHGEPTIRQLDYAAVPKEVLEQLPKLWSTVRDSSGKAVWP
jgi:phosphate transport system substrate-binding protein